MSHSDAALHRSLAKTDRKSARAVKVRASRVDPTRVSGKAALGQLSRKRERVPASPYSDPRRTWNERFGFHLDAAAMWRKWAVMSGLVALGTSILLVSMLTTQRTVPWIVHVDRQGQAQLLGPANQYSLGDDAVIKPFLVRFALDTRRVRFEPGDVEPVLARLRTIALPGSPAAQAVTQAQAATAGIDRRELPGVVFSNVTSARAGAEWLVNWDESVREPGGPATTTRRRARIAANATAPLDAQPNSESTLGVRVQSFTLESVAKTEPSKKL